MLVAGSYVLFDETQGVFVNRQLIWAIVAGLVALFLVIGGFALTVWRRKPATGREGLVGSVGTVRQTLDPDGVVFVHGELWQATAPGDTVAATPPIADARPGDRHRGRWAAALRPSVHRRRSRRRWCRRDRRPAAGDESGSGSARGRSHVKRQPRDLAVPGRAVVRELTA